MVPSRPSSPIPPPFSDSDIEILSAAVSVLAPLVKHPNVQLRAMIAQLCVWSGHGSVHISRSGHMSVSRISPTAATIKSPEPIQQHKEINPPPLPPVLELSPSTPAHRPLSPMIPSLPSPHPPSTPSPAVVIAPVTFSSQPIDEEDDSLSVLPRSRQVSDAVSSPSAVPVSEQETQEPQAETEDDDDEEDEPQEGVPHKGLVAINPDYDQFRAELGSIGMSVEAFQKLPHYPIPQVASASSLSSGSSDSSPGSWPPHPYTQETPPEKQRRVKPIPRITIRPSRPPPPGVASPMSEHEDEEEEDEEKEPEEEEGNDDVYEEPPKTTPKKSTKKRARKYRAPEEDEDEQQVEEEEKKSDVEVVVLVESKAEEKQNEDEPSHKKHKKHHFKDYSENEMFNILIRAFSETYEVGDVNLRKIVDRIILPVDISPYSIGTVDCSEPYLDQFNSIQSWAGTKNRFNNTARYAQGKLLTFMKVQYKADPEYQTNKKKRNAKGKTGSFVQSVIDRTQVNGKDTISSSVIEKMMKFYKGMNSLLVENDNMKFVHNILAAEVSYNVWVEGDWLSSGKRNLMWQTIEDAKKSVTRRRREEEEARHLTQ